jgi:catechol 2,3-dioxygenase-like lactoylglutathione lyase family enzyme
MFSHITVGVRNLDRAAAFYGAVLKPLGYSERPVTPDGGPASRCWVDVAHPLPRFYIYEPFNGEPPSAGNGSMTAFLAPSAEAVVVAHGAGLSARGVCCGPPGARPNYGNGYFGAYLFDPDGNKIHVVHRGDLIG